MSVNQSFFKPTPMTTICKGCVACCNGVGGAGVLPLTESKQNPGDLDLVLVMDQSGMYNDMGGTARDKYGVSKKPHNVASSEVDEESRKTIQIPGSVLAGMKYVDLKGNGHIYRCYIVNVHNISCRAFYHSKKHIVLHGKQFNETTCMTRFPLSKLLAQFKMTGQVPSNIMSDTGKLCPLHGRVKGVLRLLLSQM